MEKAKIQTSAFRKLTIITFNTAEKFIPDLYLDSYSYKKNDYIKFS